MSEHRPTRHSDALPEENNLDWITISWWISKEDAVASRKVHFIVTEKGITIRKFANLGLAPRVNHIRACPETSESFVDYASKLSTTYLKLRHTIEQEPVVVEFDRGDWESHFALLDASKFFNGKPVHTIGDAFLNGNDEVLDALIQHINDSTAS